MKIKAIIFDLGNVLVGFNHSIAAERIAKHSFYSEAEIYRLIFDSDLVSDYERGRIKTREFYQKMKSLLRFNLNLPKFLKIWNEIFFSNPEIEKVVKKLKKRFRLLLLSNINSSHYNYIRKKFSIVKEFDRVILSYRVGERKPSFKIYNNAIKAARCRPEEILYIDDRDDLVKEAKKLGINVIHFRGVNRLRASLEKFGINGL